MSSVQLFILSYVYHLPIPTRKKAITQTITWSGRFFLTVFIILVNWNSILTSASGQHDDINLSSAIFVLDNM